MTIKKIISGGLADVHSKSNAALKLLVNDQIIAVNGTKIGTTPPLKINALFAGQIVEMKVRTPVARKELGAAETGDCTIC